MRHREKWAPVFAMTRGKGRRGLVRLLGTMLDGGTGDVMSRGLTTALMLSLATLALAACGKRGALDAPPASEVSEKPAEAKPGEKPHRGFVLDPLLR